MVRRKTLWINSIVLYMFGIMTIFIECAPILPMSPFNFIEGSRIRPVGITVSPYPEGAPGDTLTVCAYFAGKPISKVSDFRVCKGEFDTVGTPISVQVVTASLPDSVRFIYVIPDTMLDSLLGVMIKSGKYKIDNIDIDSTTIQKALKENDFSKLNGFDTASQRVDLQFLSNFYIFCRVMFTVQSTDGEELKIRKNFMVRYNCRFLSIPELSSLFPVVHNPDIINIVLHKIPLPGVDGGTDGRKHTSQGLQSVNTNKIPNDTIEIDIGYSYFLQADVGIKLDTLPDGKRNSLLRYDLECHWFYKNIEGLQESFEKGMVLQQNEYESNIQLFPPLDCTTKGFVIYLKAEDQLQSNNLNPNGSARMCTRGIFRYTEAYKKSIGQH